MLTAAAVTGILSVPGAFAFADADADAVTADSPGVASGNSVSVPVNVPLNICGNSLDIIAALNPALDNDCTNNDNDSDDQSSDEQSPEPKTSEPAPEPVDEAPEPEQPTAQQAHTLPAPAQLAETGSSSATIAAAGLGALLLTGGVVLYRRGRTVAARA